jgi:hypothetical protein
MAPTVQSVREEHEPFLPYLEEIRTTADLIGHASVKSILSRIGEIHGFLAQRLMPHAVAEGREMLPLVRALPGGRETALEMRLCHVQLARLTDELAAAVDRARRTGMSREVENELRRILYGTHVLLAAHLAEAEEVFSAALEQQRAPSEHAAVFESVERSARTVADQYE